MLKKVLPFAIAGLVQVGVVQANDSSAEVIKPSVGAMLRYQGEVSRLSRIVGGTKCYCW
jgi:hypothetical protein